MGPRGMAGFPGGSDGKESTSNVGALGLIPGLGTSPGGGRGNPLQYSCLENSDGEKSLVGCGPWGCRVRHDWATKHTHLLLTTAISPEPPHKVGDSPAVADGSS